jgi:hypothetical protein
VFSVSQTELSASRANSTSGVASTLNPVVTRNDYDIEEKSHIDIGVTSNVKYLNKVRGSESYRFENNTLHITISPLTHTVDQLDLCFRT